jgi:uncharacterized protein DUF6600
MQLRFVDTDQPLKKENPLKRMKCSRVGFVFCGALIGMFTGCINAQPEPPRAYAPPPQVEASVSVGLPSVEIRAESDFYEPLTPYGEWVVVGSYGRCWRPGRIEAGWRPYCTGYWQRTDAGWYWVSDEPWAWATYHYGRWDFTDQYGWYWVPQIQWGPAWVSWHSGGGYIGWAPLYPSSRFARGGSLEVDVKVISPRAYVFVEERHFLEPVRPSTVVVNNTTVINKTVNITNIKVVNNTVINEGPPTGVIEKASGRKVQAVAIRELRHKDEAAVVAKQKTPASASERKVSTPVSNEAGPAGKKTVAAQVGPASAQGASGGAGEQGAITGGATGSKRSQVEKPAAAAPKAPAPTTKNNQAQSETRKPVPVAMESKPLTKAERNHPVVTKEPAGQKANKQPVKQQKPAQPADKKAQPAPEPLAKEKPATGENNGPNTPDKNHENKGRE